MRRDQGEEDALLLAEVGIKGDPDVLEGRGRQVSAEAAAEGLDLSEDRSVVAAQDARSSVPSPEEAFAQGIEDVFLALLVEAKGVGKNVERRRHSRGTAFSSSRRERHVYLSTKPCMLRDEGPERVRSPGRERFPAMPRAVPNRGPGTHPRTARGNGSPAPSPEWSGGTAVTRDMRVTGAG